jgi:hypothetical protein
MSLQQDYHVSFFDKQDLRKIMKKRTAYSYGEASYAQRLVREERIDTKWLPEG